MSGLPSGLRALPAPGSTARGACEGGHARVHVGRFLVAPQRPLLLLSPRGFEHAFCSIMIGETAPSSTQRKNTSLSWGKLRDALEAGHVAAPVGHAAHREIDAAADRRTATPGSRRTWPPRRRPRPRARTPGCRCRRSARRRGSRRAARVLEKIVGGLGREHGILVVHLVAACGRRRTSRRVGVYSPKSCIQPS